MCSTDQDRFFSFARGHLQRLFSDVLMSERFRQQKNDTVPLISPVISTQQPCFGERNTPPHPHSHLAGGFKIQKKTHIHKHPRSEQLNKPNIVQDPSRQCRMHRPFHPFQFCFFTPTRFSSSRTYLSYALAVSLSRALFLTPLFGLPLLLSPQSHLRQTTIPPSPPPPYLYRLTRQMYSSVSLFFFFFLPSTTPPSFISRTIPHRYHKCNK